MPWWENSRLHPVVIMWCTGRNAGVQSWYLNMHLCTSQLYRTQHNNLIPGHVQWQSKILKEIKNFLKLKKICKNLIFLFAEHNQQIIEGVIGQIWTVIKNQFSSKKVHLPIKHFLHLVLYHIGPKNPPIIFY